MKLDQPESVLAQKIRLQLEKMNAKRQANIDRIRELNAARIVGRPVDSTGDLFDNSAAAAPLFAVKPPKTT